LRTFGLRGTVKPMILRMRAALPLICWLAACSSDGPEEWLAGRWAVDLQACDEAWLTFSGDGSWSNQLAKGRWSADGRRLTLSLTHERSPLFSADWRAAERPMCHTETVERVSADELRTRWEDGSSHRLVRCTPTAPRLPMRGCVGDCERVTPFDPRPWNAGPPAATRTCSR
jgi:hypothetical protein